MVNVPMAVWIDEAARIVRPAEPSGSNDGFRKMDRETFALAPEIVAEYGRRAQVYKDALRDWARRGAASEHVLPASAVAERTAVPTDADARAHACFALARHLAQHGRRKARLLRSGHPARARQLEHPPAGSGSRTAAPGGLKFWAAVDAPARAGTTGRCACAAWTAIETRAPGARMTTDLRDLDREYGQATARFYDAAYERSPQLDGGDVAFYRALAREGGGPVLELGCGTGRVLLEIAADGFPCTGVDASQHMLARLRAKSRFPNLRLVHAPMQRFDLPGERFGLVFSAFRAFQHLYRRGSARVPRVRPAPPRRADASRSTSSRPAGAHGGSRSGRSICASRSGARMWWLA
jgi:hypothetical protein